MTSDPIYIPRTLRAELDAAPLTFQEDLRIHLENVSALARERRFEELAERLPKDPATNRFVWRHLEGKVHYSVDPTNAVVFVHAIVLRPIDQTGEFRPSPRL